MNSITKLAGCFLFAFASTNGFSQEKNESFYAFNANWDPTPNMDSCIYFMQEIKKSDTEFICRYYQKAGPMIKQEAYKDADLSIPNGRFCWYNEKGNIDSCGWVDNFKKDGRWEYFGATKYYEDYDKGKLIKIGNYEISKQADTAKVAVEFTVTQMEAIFKKGANDWNKYLERNLQTPDRFSKIFSPGKYTITVSFMVNKTGKVTDVYLRHSVEWSADAEVFRIIERSPDWQPATQNGKAVLYRQQQNISFEISK